MKKIRLLLGAYIDSVNAQDINCYNIARYIDKDKFEVHALTHGGNVNVPGVVCHPISRGRILKNIEKYLTMKKVDADVYYLPRVEKVDIEFAKRSKKCITSSVEIQTVYENKTYNNYFNKYISAYFCISEYLNTLNIKYWDKKVPVLYLGVSVDSEDTCRKSLKNIVWIGSVITRKRPEYLVELAEHFRNLNFTMVGDGELLESIRNKARGMSNITFTGKIDNSSVLELLNKSDLLVMTSEREGLPKVVLEAASKGVPSVYINEYYKIDYIENGINGFGVSNINSMIGAIELLVSDNKKYISCSQHASELAQRYHWSILINQYEDFLQAPIKAGRRVDMAFVEITRHELEKNIISNKYGELDFYAYCNTPWHAIGIQSFVNDLSEKKQKVSGIVFLANQPGREAIVHPEDFNFNNNVEVLYFKNIDSHREDKKKYLKKLLFSNNADVSINDSAFYMLRPFRPDYQFGAEYQIETEKKCELICLEEGVGTYKSNYEIFREKIKGDTKEGVLFAITCCFNFCLKTKYRLHISYYKLLIKQNKSLSLNKEISNMYLKTIKKAATHNKHKVSFSIAADREYAIILTQPFEIKQDVLCKNIINQEYDLIREYLSNKGIDVYIKPHPRESDEIIKDYRDRRFSILQSNIPLEMLLEVLPKKPIIVIGTLSTALITANAINHVRAISVIDLIKKQSNKSYVKAGIMFKRRYGNFVVFPQNIEQILSDGCDYED